MHARRPAEGVTLTELEATVGTYQLRSFVTPCRRGEAASNIIYYVDDDLKRYGNIERQSN